MTAGVVFLDDERRILTVKPTYRAGWPVPGGIVERPESPRAACLCELREELALDAQADRLLCVEFESGDQSGLERLNFVFFGGVLSAAHAADDPNRRMRNRGLRVCLSHAEAMVRLNPPLARRIALALRALHAGGTVYAENGPKSPAETATRLCW